MDSVIGFYDDEEYTESFPFDIIILTDCYVTRVTGDSISIQKHNNKKWNTVLKFEDEQECMKWERNVNINIHLASSVIFGSNILVACMKDNMLIPRVVKESVEVIMQGLNVEGLFRVPGNQTVVENLREQTNNGEQTNFASVEYHNLCTFLKLYFRELEDSIIPMEHTQKYIALDSIEDADKMKSKFIKYLKGLPSVNYAVVSYLISFLKKVTECSEKNKMGAENIATVFGPTVFRTIGDSPASLCAMSTGNSLVKYMLEEDLFEEEDAEYYDDMLFDPEDDMSRFRITITLSEYLSITETLPGISSDRTKFFIRRVNFVGAKGLEAKIIILTKYVMYIFNVQGKCDHQIHFLDIKLESTLKHKLKMTALIANKEVDFTFLSVSYASYDIDGIIEWIERHLSRCFIGMPLEERIFVEPRERKDSIFNRDPVTDREYGCGGIMYTYKSICTYLGTAINNEILWDLKKSLYENKIRELSINELIKNHKFPNDDFRTLVMSMKYNTYFTTFTAENLELGNDCIMMISNVLQTNIRLQKLVLKNVDLNKNNLGALCSSIEANPVHMINYLDISHNSIEDKGVQSFVTLFGCLNLTYLNIGSCSLTKRGTISILESLRESPNRESITHLDLSFSKMDNEASRLLGSLLEVSTALTTLSLKGVMPVFFHICGSLTISNITTIDLSQNRIPSKQMVDLKDFLLHLPQLTDINLADTGVDIEVLQKLISSNKNIQKLNISDNDIFDEDFIVLCDFFKTRIEDSLQELNMSRCLVKKSKVIHEALEALTDFLRVVPITTFIFAGGNKCILRNELLQFVFGFAHNKYVQNLDISGHSAGDELSDILRRVLHQNKSLRKINWDENNISLNGLKILKIGMERNKYIEELPFPMTTVSTLMKSENTIEVIDIMRELEQIVYKNLMSNNEEITSSGRKISKRSSSHKIKTGYGSVRNKRKKSDKKVEDDEPPSYDSIKDKPKSSRRGVRPKILRSTTVKY
eukprot:TRINITY_DN3727_c0_g1_i4.p1 TRINITY_DN3727_c0_g1~~TRINITY_DN3727_c0_g1_i4.p1  ORF type:complete len:986 (+),score=179.39 TRINITY_DN3727_c0_g1_i4:251-3208(+)